MEEIRPLDARYAHMLAQLIRGNLDELIEENGYRYAHDYAHSINNGLDEATKRAWTEECLLDMAAELEAGEVDAHYYEGMRGDIVLQNEELLYPIDAYLEMTFYIARMIADFVWEKCVGDKAKLNALLETLETLVQMRTRANLASFTEQILQPRALVQTWRLGRRWDRHAEAASTPNVEPVLAAHDDATDAAPINQLTEREVQIARLVAAGKSNNQIAAELGLQPNTVRNALSRIYMKMEVTSRTELAISMVKDQSP